jgi:hypothetical protein
LKRDYNYRVYRFDPILFRFRYILAFRAKDVTIDEKGIHAWGGFYSYKDLGLDNVDPDCVDSFITAFAPLEDS